MVYLLIISITDSFGNNISLVKLKFALWTAILALITIALISTALYIDFTAVAADTISGVQQRYLLPLIFPVCAFVVNAKVRCVINREKYERIVISISTVLLAFTVFVLFTSHITP